jgi:WD40 repeat protein/DNA-directed RNA polymerase specialized sigma24 family protein
MIFGPDSQLPSFPPPVGEDGKDEEPEIELALNLQNAPPGDPGILALLANRYSAGLFQLAQALAYEPGGTQMRTDEIAMLVRRVLVHATNHVNTFWGEASVHGWLARITLQFVRQALRLRKITGWWDWRDRLVSIKKRLFHRSARRTVSPAVTALKNQAEDPFQRVLKGLRGRAREAVTLYCLQGLNGTAVLQSTQSPVEQVKKRLHPVRLALLRQVAVHSLVQERSHRAYRQLVQDWTAGLLDDPASQSKLAEHLAECADCQKFAATLREVDLKLQDAVQTCWPLPSHNAREINRLVEIAQLQLAQAGGQERLRLARSWAWITGVMVIFLISGWFINRTLPEEDRLYLWSTPEPTPLPAVVQVSMYDFSDASPESLDNLPIFATSLDPRLSSDGRWVEFISSIDFANRKIGNGSHSYIFNRITGQIEPIDFDGNVRADQAVTTAADLSSDGRWVVLNTARKPVSDDHTEQARNLGVYLVNRETGEIRRIDLTPEGTEPDGNAYHPVLSGDGNRVVFWSAATDLVPGYRRSCQELSGPCLNIYLYERTSGELRFLPIGRRLDFIRSFESLSISDDGRYLALTLYADDLVGRHLAMENMHEAFVFDWQTNQWTRLNQAIDGTPGNDASSHPVLSGNGRRVAFYSAADNLVMGDTNHRIDVFARDLVTGVLEMVSVANDGQGANADSGLISLEFGYVGEDIGLSADGNLIAFISAANNLATRSTGICLPSNQNGCNAVYVRDRVAGWTERITAPQAGRFYVSARLSNDGRWVAFGELNTACTATRQTTCVDVWLYDRESRWTSPVTKGRYALPGEPWPDPAILTNGLPGNSQLAFSPDGELLAMGSSSADVRLWSVADAEQIAVLRGLPGGPVTSLVFSNDGEYLAGGTRRGTVNIWRLEDRFRLYSLPNHPGRVVGLAFAQDHKMLAVGAAAEVWVWTQEDQLFTRLAKLEYPTDFINAMALSPDGSWLAVAGADRSVWLQRLPDGDLLLRLGGHGGEITSVAFSSDGNYLATGSQDHLVNLWQLDLLGDGSLDVTYLKSLRHQRAVRSLAFSSPGDTIATVSEDGLLRLWRIPDGEPSHDLGPFGQNPTLQAVVSPNGNGLATRTYRGEIYLWRESKPLIQPRFNIREPSDQLDLPLEALSDSLYYGSEIIRSGERWMIERHNLDQLDKISGYRLQAPTSLPPGMVFDGGYQLESGSLRLDYRWTSSPGNRASGALILCQRAYRDESVDCGTRVGLSAQVESLRMSASSGEYIRGDWLPERVIKARANEADGPPTMEWSWNNQAPVQRLVWLEGSQLFSLYFRSFIGNDDYITQADLVAIGNSLTPVSMSRQFHPILINYTVQEGDTCTAIAERFKSSVNAIEMHNLFLVDACDRIYPGQTMVVPAEYDLYDLDTNDLNCDGQVERLRAVVLPQPRSDTAIAGIIAEMMAPNGFFEETWRFTINEVGADHLTRPQLFSVGSCEKFIGFNVVGGPETTAGFRAFRWDGARLVQVLAAEGLADQVSPRGPLALITTHLLQPDEAYGNCVRSGITYAWDGRAYVELDRKIMTGSACDTP